MHRILAGRSKPRVMYRTREAGIYHDIIAKVQDEGRDRYFWEKISNVKVAHRVVVPRGAFGRQ